MDPQERLTRLLNPLGDAPASQPVAHTTPTPLGRLFKFCKSTLRWPVEVRPHARICADIDEALGKCTFDYPAHEYHNTMLAYPRGTWKTSLSRGGALMIMEKNPNARQLIATFRHDQAQTRCRALRKLVEQHFPLWVPDRNEKLPWSDTAFTLATRSSYDLQEPSVDMTGIERDITGYHYDVIWMDDIVNAKNWQTQTMRNKAYNFLIDTLAVLQPGGVIVMPCTFWHPDDAYARIIEIDRERVRQGKPKYWNLCIRPAIDPETDELFYPSVLTREFLDDQRARMGSHKFSAQYLLECVSAEDRTFDQRHLRVVDFNHYLLPNAQSVVVPTRQLMDDRQWRYVTHTQIPVANTMAWDPAGIYGRKTHDYHGFTIVGTDSNDRWWVLAADRRKGPPTEIIDYAIALILRYRPHTVSCEDVGQSGTWLELLGSELDKRDIARPNFAFYTPASVPKPVRIALLQPRWERDAILLKPDQSSLRKQFEHFTLGGELEHEDEIDSLVQHLEIAYGAEDTFVETVNPIDPQWVEREARLSRERQVAAADEEEFVGGGIRGRNIWG